MATEIPPGARDGGGRHHEERAEARGQGGPRDAARCSTRRARHNRPRRAGLSRRPGAGGGLLDHQQRGPLRPGDADDPRPVGRCQLPGAGYRRRGFARFSAAQAAAWCTAGVPTPRRRAPGAHYRHKGDHFMRYGGSRDAVASTATPRGGDDSHSLYAASRDLREDRRGTAIRIQASTGDGAAGRSSTRSTSPGSVGPRPGRGGLRLS